LPSRWLKRAWGQYVGQETDIAAQSGHAQEPLIALELGLEAAISDDINHAEEHGESISGIST